MVSGTDDWNGVVGDCAGCPRLKGRDPLLVPRDAATRRKVRFLVIVQEPGADLKGRMAEAVPGLIELCKGRPGSELVVGHPAAKMVQLLGPFDPSKDDVYLTHALKCCPASDRDITKEWRKAGKACADNLRRELELLGQDEVAVLAVGKYATELCLHLFDGQDIDPDLSISELMQSNRLPMPFTVKWRSGRTQRLQLYLFTNPGKDVCTVQRKGGRLTVDEIQALEAEALRNARRSRPG